VTLVRALVATALAAFVAVMSGQLYHRREYRYPSPSQVPALLVEPEGDRHPAPSRTNRLYLLGVAHKASSDAETAPEARAWIGSFQGRWNPAAIAWTSADTVNICPLEGARGVPEHVSVLVTETQRKTIHITTDCPDFLKRSD
jgi:hypothetical protein